MAKKKALEIPCEFGGVSIGEATCRLGVRIARSHLNIIAADECLVGHRLDCQVVLSGKHHTPPGTRPLVEDLHHEISGTADVKRMGVSTDTIAAGLTFSLEDVDIAELARFSKGAGKLVIKSVSELPKEESGKHPADADEEVEGDE